MKVNKFKLFIENILIYGLGGVMSKVIPLIMVPIVTRLMPNSTYFGISDMFNTVVSFASALAMMGMFDAIYRMFFEKEDEDYKITVCSTGLLFTLGMSIIVFIVLLFCKNWIAKIFFEHEKYSYLVYLIAMATLVGATNSIVSAPTRMQNKRTVFLVINTISPILSYGISIPLLIKGYYVIALPLAAVISGLTIEIVFVILNKKWFRIKVFNFKVLKQLLMIALPLMPNFLIYWVFNSSDKIMITNLMSVADAGIYSVGSKLGHASQLIYTAFAGGWQYFAFYTMKEENQVKNNSLIFEYLSVISFVATMFICALSYPIYILLFEQEYVSGYIVSPYLFLAPLLQMIYQVAANQFLIIKKTWPSALIISSGAVFNIIANIILIPKIGIEGAAIATMLGYIVSDIIVVFVLTKMKQMSINKKFIFVVLLMIIFMVVWRLFLLEKVFICILLSCLFTIVYVLIYKDDCKRLMRAARRKKE